MVYRRKKESWKKRESGKEQMDNSNEIKYTKETIRSLQKYLGSEGIRFFSHLKGLTGTVSPVLKLNFERKKIPSYSVHLVEGMKVRNFLRGLPELDGCDYDEIWGELVELAISTRWEKIK